MQTRRAIGVSLRLLAHQWRRTATTALAFAIALGAFAAFAGITAAAHAQFLKIVRQRGAANLLTILPAQFRTIGGREVQLNALRSLTLADAEALGNALGGRANVAAVRTSTQTVRWRNRRETVTLVGTSDAVTVRITRDLATALFGYQDPIGMRIDVGGRRVTVAGLESSGEMRVLVPLRWAPVSDVDRDRVSQIAVRVTDDRDRDAVARHRLGGSAENDFTIRDESALLRSESQVSESLRLLLPAVAAVTLAIGGIGIVAVMLLAIRERAAEIGLRRAAGAARADVVLQFVFEAWLIAVPASALGELAGAAAAIVLAKRSGWPIPLERWPLLLAALATAIIFATLCSLGPALRAARLEPAAALRRG